MVSDGKPLLIVEQIKSLPKGQVFATGIMTDGALARYMY